MKTDELIAHVLKNIKSRNIELEHKFLERRKGLGYVEENIASDKCSYKDLFARKKAKRFYVESSNDEVSKRCIVGQKSKYTR